MGGRPLRFLIPRWACVRAHGTRLAAVAGVCGLDVGYLVTLDSHVLNAAPSTKSGPLDGQGAILRGEVGAVKLAVGEVLVEALVDGEDVGDCLESGAHGLGVAVRVTLGDVVMVVTVMGRRGGGNCRKGGQCQHVRERTCAHVAGVGLTWRYDSVSGVEAGSVVSAVGCQHFDRAWCVIEMLNFRFKSVN